MIDVDLLKRCELYLQKAPKYLHDIASFYDKNIYIFINWDIECPTRYGLAVIPDENDVQKDIYAILINPYTLAWKKDELEHRYPNIKIDVRDIVVFLVLHEIGHIQNYKINNDLNEETAWDWAGKEFFKIKNRIPHRNRLTKTIDSAFNISLLSKLIEK